MTPKQEKLLTEKVIRPMVKKVLNEQNASDDLKIEFRDQIQEAFETTKYMLEDTSGNRRKQIISIQRHLTEVLGILESLKL